MRWFHFYIKFTGAAPERIGFQTWADLRRYLDNHVELRGWPEWVIKD